MIETLLLSIFLTILKIIEYYKQRNVWDYTENSSNKYKRTVTIRKPIKLKYEIMKIKKQDAFKDRKIDELLQWFGKR